MGAKTVYIVNASGHDMSDATRFGVLVPITSGEVDRYNVNWMLRRAAKVLRNSGPEDYILLTSLNILCSIVVATFARKHGTLNLLLFRNGRYMERNLSIDQLLEVEEEEFSNE